MNSFTIQLHLQQIFVVLQNFLREHTGIQLQDDQIYLVESRLSSLMEQHAILSVEHLRKVLQDPTNQLTKDVILRFTTNETSFFRDPAVFTDLVNEVMPDILDRKQDNKLRILSAACSSGQEAYSIAIALFHAFPHLKSWDVQIKGFDINDEVLEKAQKGWYSQFEVNRGLPTKHVIRYFSRSGRGYQVKEDLSRVMSFSNINLMTDLTFDEKFDIVFFRNVLIYFSKEEQTQQIIKMHQFIEPEGYLVVGSTEILETTKYYQRERKGKSIWYKTLN